jgi:hypothetical protein
MLRQSFYDFADNNMLQIDNLARILSTWVQSPNWNARHRPGATFSVHAILAE